MRIKQTVLHGGKAPKKVWRCQWCDETLDGSAEYTPKTLAAHQRYACAAKLMALRIAGAIVRG